MKRMFSFFLFGVIIVCSLFVPSAYAASKSRTYKNKGIGFSMKVPHDKDLDFIAADEATKKEKAVLDELQIDFGTALEGLLLLAEDKSYMTVEFQKSGLDAGSLPSFPDFKTENMDYALSGESDIAILHESIKEDIKEELGATPFTYTEEPAEQISGKTALVCLVEANGRKIRIYSLLYKNMDVRIKAVYSGSSDKIPGICEEILSSMKFTDYVPYERPAALKGDYTYESKKTGLRMTVPMRESMPYFTSEQNNLEQGPLTKMQSLLENSRVKDAAAFFEDDGSSLQIIAMFNPALLETLRQYFPDITYSNIDVSLLQDVSLKKQAEEDLTGFAWDKFSEDYPEILKNMAEAGDGGSVSITNKGLEAVGKKTALVCEAGYAGYKMLCYDFFYKDMHICVFFTYTESAQKILGIRNRVLSSLVFTGYVPYAEAVKSEEAAALGQGGDPFSDFMTAWAPLVLALAAAAVLAVLTVLLLRKLNRRSRW